MKKIIITKKYADKMKKKMPNTRHGAFDIFFEG